MYMDQSTETNTRLEAGMFACCNIHKHMEKWVVAVIHEACDEFYSHQRLE